MFETVIAAAASVPAGAATAPFNLTTLFSSAGVSAAMAVLVGFIVERAKANRPQLEAAAASFAGTLVADLQGHIPAAFHGVVTAELQLLANNADAADATVTAVAAKILGKIAPQWPGATITDVAIVLGDTVKAFASGLASTPAAPAPSTPAK